MKFTSLCIDTLCVCMCIRCFVIRPEKYYFLFDKQINLSPEVNLSSQLKRSKFKRALITWWENRVINFFLNVQMERNNFIEFVQKKKLLIKCMMLRSLRFVKLELVN